MGGKVVKIESMEGLKKCLLPFLKVTSIDEKDLPVVEIRLSELDDCKLRALINYLCQYNRYYWCEEKLYGVMDIIIILPWDRNFVIMIKKDVVDGEKNGEAETNS